MSNRGTVHCFHGVPSHVNTRFPLRCGSEITALPISGASGVTGGRGGSGKLGHLASRGTGGVGVARLCVQRPDGEQYFLVYIC